MKNLIFVTIVYVSMFISHPIEYAKVESNAILLSDNHNDIVNHWKNVYCKEYNIPREIMGGVLFLETKWEVADTSYNAHRVGDGGKSFGPAQVQLQTARSVWGDPNVTAKKLKYDIEFNIKTSTKLLRMLYDELRPQYTTEKSTWLATLSCYNMGMGTFLKNGKKFNSYAHIVYAGYVKSSF